MLQRLHYRVFFLVCLLCVPGCSLCPDIRHKPSFHNPFPQLRRVGVLPFFNQSEEPTLDVDQVAQAYYAELQAIPGFEVLPVGITANQWRGYIAQRGANGEMGIDGTTFQEFAQQLGVDAVVVGAVTDYSSYYPPRCAMTVHWYAANPGFYPIPAGYGLPWGTRGEDRIPKWVVREAEAELAREQLATQTPELCPLHGNNSPTHEQTPSNHLTAYHDSDEGTAELPAQGTLPEKWPDPLGLIPEAPHQQRPLAKPQHRPVISHTRIYQGSDAEFTQRLAAYYELRDDARFGGWQSYLTRTDDFVRFCCHAHITEMLELRGGREESDLILRWPLNRYSR
jgi:hypothetical protein